MELDFSKNINDASGLKGLLAAETAKNEVNLLPDSEFAYIEEGGNADSFNRTVPLTLRHFPMANEAQINSSLESLASSNLNQELKNEIFEKIESKAKKLKVEIAESAMPPWLKDKKDEKKSEKNGDKKDGDKKDGDKKDGDKKDGDKKEEEPKEKSDAMKMEEDDAMMKKMYSRMDEIEKARKDMDKEYAMIKDKLGAMMKKVKASSSEDE